MPFRYNTSTSMAPLTNLPSPEINSRPQSNSENLARSPIFQRQRYHVNLESQEQQDLSATSIACAFHSHKPFKSLYCQKVYDMHKPSRLFGNV